MVTLDRIKDLQSQGLTQRSIANRLGVSIKTVEAKLRAPVSRKINPPNHCDYPVETVFVDQWYLMPCGEFARILEAYEELEYVTVSMHKSPLDSMVLLDGSNTEEFTRGQIEGWWLWDSVNCKIFNMKSTT
jgi:DNA-binding transcriptional MocR family regulator